MSKQVKIGAFLTFGLAVVFVNFFQNNKHLALFAQVNPFAEDPYDAVGSFGVQLAMFTALLSLLRAFRPFQPDEINESQKRLFLRAATLSCVSIAVTIVADMVALLRHTSVWIVQPAGVLLAAWVGAIALLVVFVGWFLHRLSIPHSEAIRHYWIRASSIALGGILILALYPEQWRESLSEALFTIFVGIAFLFGLTRVFAQALFPNPVPLAEDCLDDFIAVEQWLKAHSEPIRECFRVLDKVFNSPAVRSVLNWLNPRTHVWHLPLVLGSLIGVGLFLSELLVEQGGSPQIRQLIVVGAIYLGVECVGVLLGYALLANPLGLFRYSSFTKGGV